MNWIIIFPLAIFTTVWAERVQLTCEQIRHLVDGHNSRRHMVAQGLIPGQPAAANMKYMVWDEELAQKAARWAENGLFGHNPDRTVQSQRWSIVGENIYMNNMYSPLDIKITPNIEEALSTWFSEYMNYNFGPYEMGSTKASKTGHYTQMVWAVTSRVGCGIAQKKENDWTQTLFVCDYGPAGNFDQQIPYKVSSWSGNLQCKKGQCGRPYGENCEDLYPLSLY